MPIFNILNEMGLVLGSIILYSLGKLLNIYQFFKKCFYIDPMIIILGMSLFSSLAWAYPMQFPFTTLGLIIINKFYKIKYLNLIK